MAILYKFDQNERILSSLRFVANDPTQFNDPFEVRPCFDQERHNHFAKCHEEFYKRIGFPNSLIAGHSMVGVPTENVAGFGEELNTRFRRFIKDKFRVLCLSKNFSSALMWGHYADSHKGVVVGIDPTVGGFSTGLEPDGFEVNYSSNRNEIKLPLAFYQTPSVESYDFRGKIANRPDDLVKSDGGIIDIPFSEYRRQVEKVGLTALQTKSTDWAYEQEVRFIYDLSQHDHQLIFEAEKYFLTIPPSAIREIIFGFQTPYQTVERVIHLFEAGKIGAPKLFFSECHPFLYEIQRHDGEARYLLDYYRYVTPER